MSEPWAAFFVGCIVMSIFSGWLHIMYQKLLVMKSEDKSAECINGKFYYIVPEEDYTK